MSRKAVSRLKATIKRESGAIRGGKLSAAQIKVARENIVQARLELAQIPLAKAWAEREWRRERARLVRLWRSTGYTRAQFRRELGSYQSTPGGRSRQQGEAAHHRGVSCPPEIRCGSCARGWNHLDE
jgi:hypothetical protein